MNKTFLVFILFTFLSANDLFGQKVFREGYVVKKTGEAMTGFVEYSTKRGIPSECKFKRFDIAREVTYSPEEIQAFGYRNGNRYESREFSGKVSFFEVIVTGKIVLYQKGSVYYLDKDKSGLVQLKNGSVKYNSADGIKEFKKLPEFLNYITEGKTGTVPDKFNVNNEIVALITAYDKGSGQSYNVFSRTISEKQLSQEFRESDRNRNKIGIIGGINLYNLDIKFNPDMVGRREDSYVPNAKSETGPVVGLTYERLISRRRDRYSIRLDLLYTKQNFYCYGERSNSLGGTTIDDTYFNFSGIKLPVMFQYSLTGGRIVPYVNAGFAYQFFINVDYLHTAEVENLFHEITTSEDKNMHFKAGELSGLAGLGVRTRIFNGLNLHLQLRVEAGQGIFLNEDPTLDAYNKKAPFVQSSIQSTLLLGITF